MLKLLLFIIVVVIVVAVDVPLLTMQTNDHIQASQN
jgi:hypothetical protein